MKPFAFKKLLVASTLLALTAIAYAGTFNLFGPVTGVLKGNANSYQTTAAINSDIIGLWTGTCSASTFLRGDGSCQVPAGTGVTSVGLTMPTGFSVTGSPVTSSGTLAVSTTLSGVLHGNGSGFTASNVALGSEVTGTLPVANGGTGVATLTGIAKGNGASAFTSAANTDVIGLWTGTCSASTYLRGDGSCQSPGSGSPGGASGNFQYNNAGSFGGLSDVTYSSGTTLFSHSASGPTDPAVRIAAAAPILEINQTGAAADAKNWTFVANSGQLAFRADNDAYSVANNWLTVDRSGASISNVTFPASTIFSQAASGIGTGPFAATFSSTLPAVQFYDTNGTVDNRRAILDTNTSGFEIYGVNDAFSSNWPLLQSTFSGGHVHSLSLYGNTIALAGSSTNAAVTLNNVPVAQIQHAVFSISGSTCTRSSGTTSASCTYNGTGDYTVNWPNTFSAIPSCTANNVSGTGNLVARMGANSTTSVRVFMTAGSTGTATDGSFNLICAN